MVAKTNFITSLKRTVGAVAFAAPLLVGSAYAQIGPGGPGHHGPGGPGGPGGLSNVPKLRAQINQTFQAGQRLGVKRSLGLNQYAGWNLEHLIVRGSSAGWNSAGNTQVNLLIDRQIVDTKMMRFRPNGRPSRVRFNIPKRLQQILTRNQTGQAHPIQIQFGGSAVNVIALAAVVSKDEIISVDQRMVYQGGQPIPVKRTLRLGQLGPYSQISKVGVVAFSPGGRGTLTLVQGPNSFSFGTVDLPSRKIVQALNIKGKLVDFPLQHSQGRIQFQTTGKVVVNGLYAEVKEYAGN